MSSRPLVLTIITPTLNRASFIGEAIESMTRQGYPTVDHIVVDGGSTDQTLAILSEFTQIRVLSEPDSGVYHALNKGLGLAQGEIVGFLNSDDLYAPGTFISVSKLILENPSIRAVSGAVSVFVDDEKTQVRHIVASYPPVAHGKLSYRATLGVPAFNGWFFRKDLFDELGAFDEDFDIAADRDFLLRMALGGTEYLQLERVVYQYRRHPGSLTVSGQRSQRHVMRQEYLKLSNRFLAMDNLPPEMRENIHDWATRASAELVGAALRDGRVLTGLQYARRGWRQEVWWPWHFVRLAISNLLDRVLGRS